MASFSLSLVATVVALLAAFGPAAHVNRSELQNAVTVRGAGHYLVANSLDVKFAFFAAQSADGEVLGAFHEHANDTNGTIDFSAKVTCLAVDPQLGRAWIGGVITGNESTSPDYMGGVFETGHDIWFRVLDSPGPDGEDRSTFMGFEGAIPSSAVYCATRPWAAGNARTWPVTRGDIKVRALAINDGDN
jgi:hypothetical protein